MADLTSSIATKKLASLGNYLMEVITVSNSSYDPGASETVQTSLRECFIGTGTMKYNATIYRYTLTSFSAETGIATFNVEGSSDIGAASTITGTFVVIGR